LGYGAGPGSALILADASDTPLGAHGPDKNILLGEAKAPEKRKAQAQIAELFRWPYGW
jgi:hypothetical protein